MQIEVKQRSVEVFAVRVAIGVVLVFALLDVSHDMQTASSITHLIADVSLTVILLLALYVLLNRTKMNIGKLAKLQQAVFATRSEAEKSKLEAAKTLEDKKDLLRGLGECIDIQLGRWSLSVAEKEIAFLLLKGLTHREIAEVRKTSERTARQQSLNIYAKAGLKGRTELAAFFLEDMLAPMGTQRTKT